MTGDRRSLRPGNVDVDRDVWADARIVVVDDDPSSIRLLETILSRAGYEHVHTTGDPAAFIDGYEQLRPDLVLLDLLMPGMDGIDVLRRVRAMTSPSEFLPVLMLTADTGDQAMRRALSAGVDDFLTKPLDTVEVGLRIANLLRTRRLSLEVAAHNELLEREVQRRTADLQLFRDVLATVPDPVVIEDPAERAAVFVNDVIAEALERAERPDPDWTDGGLAALAPDVADGRRDWTLIEDAIRTADGTARPVEILVHAIHRGDQRLLAGIGRDITDRVQTQQALERTLERERQAADELARVADLKQAFLTAISHEIRTPLSVVNGAAQTLIRRGDQLDQQTANDLLGRLSANAQRLQDMLLDLLDLNRLARGQMELRPEPVPLHDLVRDRISAAELGDRPLHVALPAVEIDADRTKLARVIDALLTNVAKHTPPDTPVQITITDQDPVTITVADRGPGVPDHLKQRIFAPFEHGPTSAAHSPGTGIGLTLARTLIEAHGGQLQVDDTPGGGATFTAQLPKRDRTPQDISN